jgi:hypothetical protein
LYLNRPKFVEYPPIRWREPESEVGKMGTSPIQGLGKCETHYLYTIEGSATCSSLPGVVHDEWSNSVLWHMCHFLDVCWFHCSAWLHPQNSTYAVKLSRRIGSATNLDAMRWAELLQVSTYGIGGHYEPHYGFSEASRIFIAAIMNSTVLRWETG